MILLRRGGRPNHVPGDYIYHDGENRRFQSGAWGIIRVLPSLDATVLKPLPGTSIPTQQASALPVHRSTTLPSAPWICPAR